MVGQVHDVDREDTGAALHQWITVVVAVIHVPDEVLDQVTGSVALRTCKSAPKMSYLSVIVKAVQELETFLTVGTLEELQ